MSDFWKTKRLEQMSSAEWESLCDGCGRCCLNKLEDIDSGEIVYTNVACRLLDTDLCHCTHYVQRHLRVPDCVRLTPRNLDELRWMPPTCAYRLLNEGRPLPDWHPLVSGRPETVHEAGISVRGRIVSERDVPTEDLADYIVNWPNMDR